MVFQKITNCSEISSLVDNSVAEDKFIEYKEKLLGGTDDDKKEFLADVSSFANSAGGNLIFGIKAEEGIAIEIAGLRNNNFDSEILRLENIIRDGISPRISSIQITPINCDQKSVLVIHIPRSWAIPHMVRYKNISKFYGRNSAGKYQLDVGELRNAFAMTETIADRIRNFRLERLSIISSCEIPVVMMDKAKTVLHIIPFNAFDPMSNYDLSILQNHSQVNPRPIMAHGWGTRYNFDGLLIDAKDSSTNSAYSYVQFFRNGIIEAVTEELTMENNGEKIIESSSFEKELKKALSEYIVALKLLGVEPPFVLMLSLINIKGYIMAAGLRFSRGNTYPIDRDVLMVPDIFEDSYDFDSGSTMKPLFDAIWNASGWPGSIYYDRDGQWIG